MPFIRLTERTRGGVRAFAVAVSLAAAMGAAACASDAGSGAASSVATEERDSRIGAEEISFGESLAQLRGHHLVSLELYRAADFEGATIHASHPIEELVTAVRGELEEHDSHLGVELAKVLNFSLDAIEERAPASDLRSIYANAARVTEEAAHVVVGEAASSSSYRGSVVAALLATAAHEYEEAAGHNGIELPVEYQDGYAFVREAERLYDDIQGDVAAAAAEEAAEIQEAFASLEKALPSATPPRKPASVEEVEEAVELVGHELEETVGAVLADEADPRETAEEIEELLGEIVRTYEAGNADEAAELSAEAYLENYEVIEADVIEHAPKVNAELEPLLGAELRRRIQEGAPPGEIADMTERAEYLLGRALAALEDAS